MSLLVPSARDQLDAHGHLDQDVLFEENVVRRWKFDPVPGFFAQTDPKTDDVHFNYVTNDFGAQKSWQNIIEELEKLNDSEFSYKLVFFARHGEGYHNIASAKHASDWMQKWRYLGTDGEIIWGPDPKLTQRGLDQARENNLFWKAQIKKGAPIPTKFWVSPLSRSIDTLFGSWKDIEIPKPVVIENVRETIGVHPCNIRSTRSQLEQRYPDLEFDKDFTENDELHVKFVEREQLWRQFVRAQHVLERLFESCDDTVVNITSHAGMIRAFVTALGHRKFTVPTGGQIPIIIRGERNSKD